MRSFFAVLAFLSIAFVLLSFSAPSHAATTQLTPNCTDYTNCTTLFWNSKSTWANGVRPGINVRADIQPYFCNILFYLPDNVTVSGIRFLPCTLANDTTVITLVSSTTSQVPVSTGHFTLTNVTVIIKETMIETLAGFKLINSTLNAVDADSAVKLTTGTYGDIDAASTFIGNSALTVTENSTLTVEGTLNNAAGLVNGGEVSITGTVASSYSITNMGTLTINSAQVTSLSSLQNTGVANLLSQVTIPSLTNSQQGTLNCPTIITTSLSANSSTLNVTNLQVGPATGPCSVSFNGLVSIKGNLVLSNCTGQNTFTISKAEAGLPLITLDGSLSDNSKTWTSLDVSSLVLDVNANYTFMTYSSAVVDFSSHTTLPGADYTVNFTANAAFLSRAGGNGGGLSLAAIIGISVAVGLGVLVVVIIIIVAVVRSRKGYSSI